MRRFLVECAGFLAVQALIFLGLEYFYRCRYVHQDFLAAWNDKAARLEAVRGPRVLLVGGSNLAFGVDSPSLERLLGRPVVNLGLNAGLGRELILRAAEAQLRAGDVVVLALEFELFGSRDRPGSAMLLRLLDAAPGAVRFVDPEQWGTLLDGGLNHLALRPRRLLLRWWKGAEPPDGVYARGAFNRRGDIVAHRRQHAWLPPDRHVSPARDPRGTRVAIARLNLFAGRARARGARVFITAPPVPEDEVAAQAAAFGAFWELLDRELDVPRLERRPLAFPRREFYDTPYHLGAEATRKRTEHLFVALRRALATPAAARGAP